MTGTVHTLAPKSWRFGFPPTELTSCLRLFCVIPFDDFQHSNVRLCLSQLCSVLCAAYFVHLCSPTRSRGTRGRWKAEREPDVALIPEQTRDKRSRHERDVKSFRGHQVATEDRKYQPERARGDSRDVGHLAPGSREEHLSHQKPPDDGRVLDNLQKTADPLFVPRSDRFFSVRQSPSLGSTI